jgi:hypothetical protein
MDLVKIEPQFLLLYCLQFPLIGSAKGLSPISPGSEANVFSWNVTGLIPQ